MFPPLNFCGCLWFVLLFLQRFSFVQAHFLSVPSSNLSISLFVICLVSAPLSKDYLKVSFFASPLLLSYSLFPFYCSPSFFCVSLSVHSAPRLFAPHQPRLDHTVFYAGIRHRFAYTHA